MKKCKLKNLTSIVISLIIILSGIPPISAASNSISNGNISDKTIDKIYNTTEKKEICDATIEDDFEDNSVIVVLNHNASLDMIDYDTDDFDDIEISSVEFFEYNDNLGNRVKDFTEARDELLKEFEVESNYGVTEESYQTDNDYSESFEKTYAIKADELNKLCEPLYEKYDVDKEDVENFNRYLTLILPIHSKQNVLDTVKKLEERDDIIIAQPNYHYESQLIPNDTHYISQQQSISQLIGLENAWNISTGSSTVKVGVIDTGIDITHPDLSANVNSELGYGIYYSENNSFSPYYDAVGHGTMVAGIIGAVGNNGVGISGVNWNVDLISLRHSNYTGSVDSKHVLGSFDYAIENDIDIINCSFGGTSTDVGIKYKIEKFKGLVVCAAGNTGKNNDDIHQYPASFELDNIISVAATDGNNLASYSNYGENSVDLAAPGSGIYSTYLNHSYHSDSGTSLATPYVTGVAALIKSVVPDLTAIEIKDAILDNVDILPGLQGKVKTGGRLNAYQALLNAEEYEFTVKYNNNGGAGYMSPTIVDYGNPTNLRKNTFFRPSSGTSFYGWYAYSQYRNEWLYTDGVYSDGQNYAWFTEGEEESGYNKLFLKMKRTSAN